MKSILLLTIVSLTIVACDSKISDTAYPLSTCVVSGEKLGEMGNPVILHYEGTEVRLCCDSCIKKFEADPAKYVAKLK